MKTPSQTRYRVRLAENAADLRAAQSLRLNADEVLRVSCCVQFFFIDGYGDQLSFDGRAASRDFFFNNIP